MAHYIIPGQRQVLRMSWSRAPDGGVPSGRGTAGKCLQLGRRRPPANVYAHSIRACGSAGGRSPSSRARGQGGDAASGGIPEPAIGDGWWGGSFAALASVSGVAEADESEGIVGQVDDCVIAVSETGYAVLRERLHARSRLMDSMWWGVLGSVLVGLYRSALRPRLVARRVLIG
jgi:hypothetical protein